MERVKKRQPIGYSIFIIFSILIIFCLNCRNNVEYSAKKGILLVDDNFSHQKPFRLIGDWKLYWNQFLKPGTPLPESGYLLAKQPSHWNKQMGTGIGYGTYVLRIQNLSLMQELGFKILYIYSAYELYVNGKLIRKVGNISESRDGEEQEYLPDIVKFENYNSSEVEIRLLISNHVSYRGGIGNPILFGTFEQIRKNKEESIAIDLVVFGSLFFIGIYHIGFYIFRRKEISTLYFGLFCISVGLRMLFLGESGFIYGKTDFIPWELEIRFIYFLLYSVILSFSGFLKSIFSAEYPKISYKIIVVSNIIFIFGSIFLPLYYAVSTVIVVPYMVGFSILVSAFVIGKSIVNKREGALLYAIGFLILSSAAINDVLYDNRIIYTGIYLPYGAIFFVIFYSFSISMNFSLAFSKVEQLSRSTLEQSKLLEKQNYLLESKNFEIMQINSAYQKFIPKEFLNLLNKESITHFNLGDHTEKEMTILFSDIRSFSSLSETMLPEDNFEFINGYLKRIGPLIREHNGFIDKYIGDAIMALFHETPDDAIDAAINMLAEVNNYNLFRLQKGRIPIAIGTGINTGKLILGIVGEESRMNGTVISDSVNLASRLESLTKYYKSSILISDQTYKKLPNPDKYIHRVLDTVRVKGKKGIVSIIEILNGNSDVLIQKRLETKENFEFGLILFQAADFKNAINFFTKVLKVDPEDTAADLYLKRSEYYKFHGTPPNWAGIIELQNK